MSRNQSNEIKIFTFLILLSLVYFTQQHGAMIEPPSRNAAFLIDDDFKECCTNYDYNENHCGGTTRQWMTNGGKCGV